VTLLEKEHTMTQIEKVLYTAKAHTTGGRDGASRSSDASLSPEKADTVQISKVSLKLGSPVEVTMPREGQIVHVSAGTGRAFWAENLRTSPECGAAQTT
jgi:hypothetical protein